MVKILVELRAGQLRILELLGRIIELLEPGPATEILFDVELEDGQILYGVKSMIMTVTQQRRLFIKPVDKHGNPAKLDGVPVWAVDNSEVVTLTPEADGLACLAKSVGPLGSVKVSVTGDADLGSGVKPIVGVLDIEVTAGEAVTFNIESEDPTEQAEPVA